MQCRQEDLCNSLLPWVALKGGGEGGTWQWQGNENFILIAAVSAVRCQLLPPGGHFGKNPLF